MSAVMMSPFLLILVILLACVGGGIYLIVTSTRRSVAPGPHCGNCGYNLTGAPANRCPECGKLFIEAGIITTQQTTSRPRLWVGISLLAAPFLLCVLSSFGCFLLGVPRLVASPTRSSAGQAASAQQPPTTSAPLTVIEESESDPGNP